MGDKLRLACTECERADEFSPNPGGPTDESARVAGWRLGANGRGEQVSYCPECAGTDEEYWDRRTLAVAYAAGIDAGNQAWS